MKENLATGSHLPLSTHLSDDFKFLMSLVLSFDLDFDFHITCTMMRNYTGVHIHTRKNSYKKKKNLY